MRPYACEIANKMDPEIWVHHYDLENNRVAPETPPVINFGRPSQDMAGAPSTMPSSSTLAAPVTGNPAGAEPTLKTPAAPTPSRISAGDRKPQEHEDGTPFSQDDFKAEEKLVRPYACEIANKMDTEVWVHHYDLENKRVAPETPEIVKFGRPSQEIGRAHV